MDGSARTFHTQHEGIADTTFGIVGSSEPIEALRAVICRFAPLPAPVLVTGETGTGKELVARALHDLSRRRSGPFVTVNAAAFPSTLVATELFGHEQGAFTGATRRHLGAFEQAHKGTLFIDEVADLALDLQAWLLRVLESGEVRRLGAERTVHVDVRVIAATNADLVEAVRAHRFRADLYWRLAVLPIPVPPLRDRREDITALAEHLVAGFGLSNCSDVGIAALQALALHDWPGNVRELRSVLLRAVAGARGATLDAPDIVRAIGERPFAGHDVRTTARAALLAAGGNIAAAARSMGVPRSTFRDRLREDAGRCLHEPRRRSE